MSTTTTSGGFSLQHAAYEAPPVHIPDMNGDAYKTELVIRADETPDADGICVEKILWWHDNDPRKMPHNHPWDFYSTIMHGGYTDERWSLQNGVWTQSFIELRAGDTNHVPQNTFHNVTNLLTGTVTHMRCGALIDNNWTYLDTNTFEEIPNTLPEDLNEDGVPLFVLELNRLNPHRTMNK